MRSRKVDTIGGVRCIAGGAVAHGAVDLKAIHVLQWCNVEGLCAPLAIGEQRSFTGIVLNMGNQTAVARVKRAAP